MYEIHLKMTASNLFLGINASEKKRSKIHGHQKPLYNADHHHHHHPIQKKTPMASIPQRIKI